MIEEEKPYLSLCSGLTIICENGLMVGREIMKIMVLEHALILSMELANYYFLNRKSEK